jgi:hypothetical protein
LRADKASTRIFRRLRQNFFAQWISPRAHHPSHARAAECATDALAGVAKNQPPIIAETRILPAFPQRAKFFAANCCKEKVIAPVVTCATLRAHRKARASGGYTQN